MSQEDIEAIKEDYLDSLKDELTFNSKPAINNLTTIAGENINLAEGIVKALVEHLNKCPPSQKLPALYLMDSICKNIGNPYNTYFGLQLYKTFTNTYSIVDEPVRLKMIGLFETWKRPVGDAGQALFSSEPMRKIDDFVTKIRAKQQTEQRQKQAEHARQFMASGPLSAAALLAEVDKLIDLTRQRRRFDPNSGDAATQLNILSQLKQLLSSNQVDPSVLPTIQQQLATFNQKEVERLNDIVSRQSAPPQPQAPLPLASQANNGLAGVDLSKLFNQQFQHPQAQIQQQQQQQQQNIMPQFQPIMPQQQPHQSNTNSQPHPPVITPDIFNGLRDLLTKTPTPQPATAVVELTSQSLQKSRPNLIESLYSNLREQCGTCGKRFQNSDQGRKEKTSHLDWHFRINKRLREQSLQQNRCWYQALDDWIKYHDEDEVLGLGLGDGGGFNDGNSSSSANGGGSGKKKPKASKEELMAKYVEAPSGKAQKSTQCPICKEKFKVEWSDEAEQWVWKNAVKVGNRIYHATCHAETDESSNSGGAGTGSTTGGTATNTSSNSDRARSATPSSAALSSILSSMGSGAARPSSSASVEQKQATKVELQSILASLSKRKREEEGEVESDSDKKIKIEQ